ncbi:hypothetical protein VTK73DRAFT_6275 [Phialemonium thermophilum]|uniref:Uncharacterized protein n=1 Tax=Phialemonium thermophilum TaxID=223376 RepID=A0ABR3V0D0_9PEZI
MISTAGSVGVGVPDDEVKVGESAASAGLRERQEAALDVYDELVLILGPFGKLELWFALGLSHWETNRTRRECYYDVFTHQLSSSPDGVAQNYGSLFQGAFTKHRHLPAELSQQRGLHPRIFQRPDILFSRKSNRTRIPYRHWTGSDQIHKIIRGLQVCSIIT